MIILIYTQPAYTNSTQLTRHFLFVCYCIVIYTILKAAFYECNFTFLVVHDLDSISVLKGNKH